MLTDEGRALANEYQREYRKNNKEKFQEYNRRYREKNKDKVKGYKEAYWNRKAQEVASDGRQKEVQV